MTVKQSKAIYEYIIYNIIVEKVSSDVICEVVVIGYTSVTKGWNWEKS